MVHDGSLEVKETIASHILLMESHGLRPLLEMRYLQPPAGQWHGMVHDGSLEVKETIASPILLMESHGLRPLLEMRYFQPPATQ